MPREKPEFTEREEKIFEKISDTAETLEEMLDDFAARIRRSQNDKNFPIPFKEVEDFTLEAFALKQKINAFLIEYGAD